ATVKHFQSPTSTPWVTSGIISIPRPALMQGHSLQMTIPKYYKKPHLHPRGYSGFMPIPP
ncbi:hypothetical protein L9F63_018559, partial [Diploptera punctata]